MTQKRDYYDVLGLSREASADEIKRAYRKIAMQNHPDRNPGDAECEARFKVAAEAYAVLGDEQKKARYDRYGHAGVEGSSGGGFSSMEDIFSQFGDLFGGHGGGGGIFDSLFGGGGRRRGRRRGASLRADIEMTLEEVATGCTKTLEVNRPEKCTSCEGSGAAPGSEPKQCSTCGGIGQVQINQGFLSIRQACPHCAGAGTVIEKPCKDCGGRGLQARKEPVEVRIPAGIEDGHAQQLEGLGEAGPQGGPPGDLIVVVHVKPHALFRRHGDDLLAQARISFRQATLGDTVDIPTLVDPDETLDLKVPTGTQPGDRLRMRGQGLPRADGYGKGDLHVIIQVDVPKKVSDEQRELLEKFDELDQARHGAGKGRKKGIFEKVRDIFH